ncbi:uncharacterized protein LOC123344433 [Mauremys mutica]|uniref:uncharacterized protein LOC123344433 n=1 Tax=Mauremys mutica TaxID=74926 RepID=UPI001D14CDD7|nr:uncharacterized protein LOC123344433 [Mauremys mutica]
MVTETGCRPHNFPTVGVSPHRPVRILSEPQMPELFAPFKACHRVPVGRFSHSLDSSSALRISPVPSSPQGLAEAPTRQSTSHLDCASVAQATLVHHAAPSLHCQPDSSAASPGPYHPRSRHSPSPRPDSPPPYGMAPVWLDESELRCSAPVQHVLLSSRKPSTRSTYLAKWKRFTCWAQARNADPSKLPVPVVLDYLWSLKEQGLALSSLKVHLVAISAFHPGESGHTVFSHPLTARFRKGLERLYPQVRRPTPT